MPQYFAAYNNMTGQYDHGVPPPSTSSGGGGGSIPSAVIPPLSSTTAPRGAPFNVVQTFFVDPAAVQNAGAIMLTSVDLFFRSKPPTTLNSSGIINPGVVVSICEVTNGTPDLSREFLAVSRLTYDEIFSVGDASVATTFGFNRPIHVSTGRYYGVVVRLEDSDFKLWTNKKGDALVGTNSPSAGSTGSRDGSYYSGTNTTNLTAQTDLDLKFRVKVAKYDISAAIDIDMVNKEYEFLTVDTRTGTFVGGEDLFVASTAQAGTINVQSGSMNIVGSGTTFTGLQTNQGIIIQSGGSFRVARIGDVTDNVTMTIDTPINISNAAAVFFIGPVAKLAKANYIAGKLVLSDSTANSTVKFTGGATVRGSVSNTTANIVSVDTIGVDEFLSHVNVVTQSQATVQSSYDMATSNTTAYAVSNTFAPLPQDLLISVGSSKRYLLSRSLEASQGFLYSAAKKSTHVKVSIGSTNAFVSPFVEEADANLTLRQMAISNTTSHLVGGADAEIGPNGPCLSKHFTKKMTFEGSRQAEALRVFGSMYRPPGTELRVYAKLHNSADIESFDDKNWSPLEIKNGKGNIYSSSAGAEFLEYEFGLPRSPESLEVLVGAFTTSSGSAIITGNGTADLTTKVQPGTLIKIYNPFFSDTNYVIASVASRTSGVITLNENVTDANVLGNGMVVDVLKYNTAFSNKSGGYIARYYNSALSSFDKYNTVQIKIVLQSDNTHIIPRCTQLEVIGVSA